MRTEPLCEKLRSALQQGSRGANSSSGGAEPSGSVVLRGGPTCFGTAEQTNTSASAPTVQNVSTAGSTRKSDRAAADRTGNEGEYLQHVMFHNVRTRSTIALP